MAVETIFDYNPTEQELRRFRVKREDECYEESLALLKESMTSAKTPEYYCIGLLFAMRGETEKANDYFAKIPYWQKQLFVQDF